MLLCKSHLACFDGYCTNYGSLPNGKRIGQNGVDLCQSHYVNNNGVCEDGPTLIGDVFVNSTDTICHYSNGDEYSAVCGYHRDGKAICKPGAATLLDEWKEVS